MLRSHKKIYMFSFAFVALTMQLMVDQCKFIKADWLSDIFTVLGMGMLFLTVCFENKYNWKQLLKFVPIFALALISAYLSRQFYYLTTVLIAFSMIGRECTFFIRLVDKVKLYSVVFCAIYFFLNNLLNNGLAFLESLTHPSANAWGFRHPNFTAAILLWVILDDVYINYEKISFRKIVLLVVEGYLIYYFTLCDTAFIILVFTAILLLLMKTRSLKKPVLFLSRFAFSILLVVHFVLVDLYANGAANYYPILVKLDEMLSSRIRDVAYIFYRYGYTLLGEDIKVGKNIPWDSYFRISKIQYDTLFDSFLVEIGLINGIIVAFLLFLMAKRGSEKDKIFVYIFTAYGIIQNFGLNCFYCPILLISLVYFLNGRKQSTEDNVPGSIQFTDLQY